MTDDVPAVENQDAIHLARDGAQDTAIQSKNMGRRTFLGASLGAAGLAAAGSGFLIGREVDDQQATPELVPSEADLGFLTDMSVHHGQALVLCQRVLGRDVGGPVAAAASEVLQNQAIELGMMRAWLADWGASTAPPEMVMAWMWCGEMPLASMPGYATDEELAELAELEGLAQGRLWLELMSAHHAGGVAMAQAASSLVTFEKVARLAAMQVAVQGWEIEQYELLLSTTYAV